MKTRIIKFRAWDKNKKCFVKDFSILMDGFPIRMRQIKSNKINKLIDKEQNDTLGGDWGDYSVCDFSDWYGCENIILQQFTGLTDKNGKEIYEGDILQDIVDKRLFNWLVTFRNGCFGIQNIGVDGYLMDFYHCDNEHYFKDRFVVGNIYEDEKLLKK